MVRFTGQLHGLKFSQNKHGKTMDQAIQRLIRQAAREWVRAVILRVPVWTGQAMGSIKFASGPGGNLGRFLNVAIPIVPKETRKGKNAGTGAAYGHYNFTTGNHVYRFRFRSTLIYFIHNEFFARTDWGASGQQIQAPWRSMQAGAEAFLAEIRRGKTRLPKIQNAIEKIVIPIPS